MVNSNSWNCLEKKSMDFRKWSVLEHCVRYDGPQNCYNPRVLCFFRKLGCQKLIRTNILGGDRVQLCPGRIPNSYYFGPCWRDFLELSNTQTDNLSCFYTQQFLYQVLLIDNHRWNRRLGINWVLLRQVAISSEHEFWDLDWKLYSWRFRRHASLWVSHINRVSSLGVSKDIL